MTKKLRGERLIEIIIHICVWAYVFVSPLITRRFGEEVDWAMYFRRLYFPITTCVMFYINYLVLVPRLLLAKRYVSFVIWNALLVIVLLLSRDLYAQLLPPIAEGVRRGHRRFRQMEPSLWTSVFFTVRNVISLIFAALIAIGVRLSLKWKKAENARREAELARSEAELQNLKNQINPHFLLNTLNNIYALTAFDPQRAQEAISELSHMLRYMLYENQASLVSLRREAEFLQTYISLMRIRLGDEVDIRTTVDLPPGDRPEVAPLIFISLVENAFKHGISPTRKSFIHLHLTATETSIRFECRNSNFPKDHSDKSPGGIGLDWVGRRLEHTYPGCYTWLRGVAADGAYESIITLNINEQ